MGGSGDMLKQLQRYKDEYNEQVKVLEEHGAVSNTNKTVAGINAMISEIKNLRYCGPVLQEIQKLEILSVRDEQREKVFKVKTQSTWWNDMVEKYGFVDVKKKKGKKKKEISKWTI